MTHLYSFDQHPHHKEQLDTWAQQWIDNAMSTAPANRAAMTEALTGLYQAADLTPPPAHRQVFVRSPLTAHIAGGVAAGVWWLREHPERHRELFGRTVSEAELMAAVPMACAVVVECGMARLEGRPVPRVARVATYAATRAATRDATRAVVSFLIRCTQTASWMHDGGSDWSAWSAYLSFFDRIANLDLPIYAKWRHYEQAAVHGASRIMHGRFWIVSDRHTEVHVDAQRRLHSEDGPARAWADGWTLWYWHGTQVPRDLIETGWDTARIMAEENAEVRRCAIERLGWDAFLDSLGAEPVASADDPGNPGQRIHLYDLPAGMQETYDQPARLLLCTNGTVERDGTRRRFALPVPARHTDPVEAAAELYNWPVEAYRRLEVRR